MFSKLSYCNFFFQNKLFNNFWFQCQVSIFNISPGVNNGFKRSKFQDRFWKDGH